MARPALVPTVVRVAGLLVLWICTSLSGRATEPPIRIAGPWVVLGGQGSAAVLVEFAGTLDEDRLRLVQLRGRPGADGRPRVLDLRPRSRRITRPWQAPSTLVSFRLGAAERLEPGLGLWMAGRGRVELPAVRPPAPGSEARVVFLSARTYPTRARLRRMAEALGGAPQLGVLTGDDWAGVLGHGDWEPELPLVLLETGPGGQEGALRGLLADGLPEWTGRIRWGAVDIPLVAPGTDTARLIGAGRGEWTVPLYLHGPWDLSLSGPADRREADGIGAGVRACRDPRVPVILDAGSPAGLLSIPLGVDARDHVVGTPRGVRYLTACPGGEVCAWLPEEACCSLPDPCLLGLRADGESLELVLHEDDGRGPVPPLRYTREAERSDPCRGMDAAGTLDLLADWRGAGNDPPDGEGVGRDAEDSPARRALLRLAWSTTLRPVVARLEEADLKRLATDPDPAAGLLLLRLAATHHPLANAWLFGEDSPRVRHLVYDMILRQLRSGDYLHEPELRRLMAETGDHRLVEAILVAAERRREPVLFGCLLDRLARQAAGTVSLAASPLDQHRLVSACFDSPYVSPTPLRRIARPLRERLSPLARAPVDRFLRDSNAPGAAPSPTTP